MIGCGCLVGLVLAEPTCGLTVYRVCFGVGIVDLLCLLFSIAVFLLFVNSVVI